MLRNLILACLLLSSTTFAAGTDVTREAEGFGATQQEALTNALVEAVRQVRGTAVGVDRGVEETLAIVAGTDGSALLERGSKPFQEVYTESRGFVRRYEILQLARTGEGYYARIRAVVPVFESAISDEGRQRIAVLPFRVSSAGFRLADHGDPVTFSQRLADSLVSELAADPAVVLVNRDFFAELALEKTVLAADAAPEELTKLGASVGADFLLVGRVQEARTEREAGAYGGSAKITDEIRLSWRLVEAATGKILRAGDIHVDQKRKTGKSSYGAKSRADFEAGDLFAALAGQIGDAALEKPRVEDSSVVPETQPAPLTPGSSDRPVQW